MTWALTSTSPGRPAGPGQPLRQRRMGDLVQVPHGVERVDVHPVGHLAGHAERVGVHRRQVDRRRRGVDGPGIEELGEQIEPVELAVEVERGLPGESGPDRPQRLHLLGQLRRRLLVRDGEAPLVVGLHLRAEPEPEPAPAGPLQLPRRQRRHHRAADEGQGDGRAHLQPAGRLQPHRHGEERVVGHLGHPDAVVARPPPPVGLSRGRAPAGTPPAADRASRRSSSRRGSFGRVRTGTAGRRPAAATPH